MEKSHIKIILAGEGGQGIQTIAKIITDSAARSDYQASYLPSFGVEQRGAPSVAFVIINQNEINYPRFETADFAVILQSRAVKSVKKYINNKSSIIFDSSTIEAKSLKNISPKLFGLPATNLAFKNSIARSFNVLIAGKLCHLLGLKKDGSWASVQDVLGRKFKNKKIEMKNKTAFDLGWQASFENKIFTDPTFHPTIEEQIFRNEKRKGRVIPAHCKGCGLCLEICPTGAIKFSQKLGVYGTPVPEIDIDKCIGCGQCFNICPDVAIKVENLQK